jgi:hypothetical protein
MEEIQKLKAAAYDAIRQIDLWQAKLIEIEKQINKLQNDKS